MKRRFIFALAAAGIVATLAVTVAGTNAVETSKPSQAQNVQQPDTSSSRWKAISDDVGILTADDERLGLRGRLYVRVNGTWKPVAVDGAADIGRMFPAK